MSRGMEENDPLARWSIGVTRPDDGLARILSAWTVEGPNPEYHRLVKLQLRENWPALATALDAALHAAGGHK